MIKNSKFDWAVLLCSLIFSFNTWAQDQTSKSYKVEEITRQKDAVWGFDFLDVNQIIFTEREGALFVLDLKIKKQNP